jgi:hypothetical protein
MASPAHAFALIVALTVAGGIVGSVAMHTPPTMRLKHEETVVHVKAVCMPGTPNTKISNVSYGALITGPNCLTSLEPPPSPVY